MLNFPRFWGKSDTFCLLSVYLTFNPGKRSAKLQKGPNNERFPGNERAVFVLQWLTERSWSHSMFFTAQRSSRRYKLDLDRRMPNEACLNL